MRKQKTVFILSYMFLVYLADTIIEDPVPAVLTAVCTISREDYWLLSDASGQVLQIS